MTPAEEREAVRLHEEYRWKPDRIAEVIGSTIYQVRKALDPEYQAKQCAASRIRRKRQKRKSRRDESARRRARIGLTRQQLEFTRADSRIEPDVLAARLAEIPEDTRTPAQRLLGDPIPARSALAMRQA